MNITVAAYNFSGYGLSVWKPLEITRETQKCYFAQVSKHTERRFLKDEIGKIQYHESDIYPCVKVVMIDATEDELRAKIAEWFEQEAKRIRKTN